MPELLSTRFIQFHSDILQLGKLLNTSIGALIMKFKPRKWKREGLYSNFSE